MPRATRRGVKRTTPDVQTADVTPNRRARTGGQQQLGNAFFANAQPVIMDGIKQQNPLPESWNDLHKAVSRFVLAQGRISQQALRDVMTEYKQDPVQDMSLVAAVNAKLRPMNIELRRVSSDVNGAVWYVLFNLNPKQHMEVGTAFDKSTFAFYRLVVDTILSASKGRLSFKKTRDLYKDKSLTKIAKVKALTRDKANRALDTFVEKGWLEQFNVVGDAQRTRNGTDRYFTLGVRAFAELKYYIKEALAGEEARQCTNCNDVTVYGHAHKDHGGAHTCSLYFHMACKQLRFTSPTATCPECKRTWSDAAEDQDVAVDTQATETDAQTPPEETADAGTEPAVAAVDEMEMA